VGNLIEFKVRFTKQTWPDNELVTRIAVTGKREDGGKHLVDLSAEVVQLVGDKEVTVLSGEASASLASRVA
jgi:hypothetical protein